jgi:glycosyltransferase involved in cell wall biosynthesis
MHVGPRHVLSESRAVRVLLVTNFTPHYRAPLYERLAKAIDVEFIFFSQGTEPYWQEHLGTTKADIRASTIVGRHLGAGLNCNPRLAKELWTRDYDVLIKCLNGRVELASAYTIAKARRKPFIFWNTIWWHPATFLGWLSQPPLKMVYRGADAILTDGGQISRFVAGYGVDPAKIFTAECSVDNDWFMRPVKAAERDAVRESLGAAGRPIILAVSRLVPEKGLDGLVRAAAKLGDLEPVVAVIGTGPLGDALTAQARAADVDLRILGGLPPSRMPAFYAASDVYTMPSVTTPQVREPWGLGVNEAHCQSLPVVVSDAVGAAAGGLVVHNESGLIVPERDDGQLAVALRRVLSDRAFANGLAAAGHERVQATNFDAMVASFIAAIDFAVAAHGGRWRGSRKSR